MLEKISFYVFLVSVFPVQFCIFHLPGTLEMIGEKMGVDSGSDIDSIEETLDMYKEEELSPGNRDVQDVFSDLNTVDQHELLERIS
eukprot:UN18268